MFMKKLIILLAFFFFLTSNFSCSKKCESSGVSHECDNNDTQKVGCMCNDGTQSTATGSGACSGHGGVKHWLCDDCR